MTEIEVIKFWNPENTGNNSMQRSKMDIFEISKSIFYIFWDKCLKLGSYVLETETKLSKFQVAKIENIDFRKLPVPIFEGFWATGNFQNSIFSLLEA